MSFPLEWTLVIGCVILSSALLKLLAGRVDRILFPKSGTNR